ncbi:MAG: hypothetical protein OXR72_20700, partial [Gemmatimonadota bacterium]|nr:hypothetical protein [Gemmatimonadota bacterium]
MWRGLVATVSAALLLVSPTFTGDDSSLKSRSAIAQGLQVMEVMPEYAEDLSSHPRLLLDSKIETPPQNNNARELPEKQAGDTIQFQIFAPGAAGRQIQGYTIELALPGKTFGSYVDDVSGADLNGNALLSRVSGSGNSTLSMLSLSAVAIPSSGFLGQANLGVSRALTSSDSLTVQSASIAGPGGVQNLDVADAVLTFMRATAQCLGDFDGNNKVNFSDFILFAAGFGARSGDAEFNATLDLDESGAIDFSDFILFASQFGTTCDTSPPVRISDANLRAVIEDSLGKEKGAEITRSEMAKLTRLEAPNAAIRQLTGLEYAVNLKWLDLGEAVVDGQPTNSNAISVLGPLSAAPHLVYLDLNSNSITDVSALFSLTRLEVLRLSRNRLRGSIPAALGNLSKLEALRLDNNLL